MGELLLGQPQRFPVCAHVFAQTLVELPFLVHMFSVEA